MSFLSRSLVPVPLPDECIYSVAAAFARKWFQGSRRGALLLFGGGAPAARDIPARLPQLAECLPEGLELDARQLALRHTALPLHLPFLAEDRQEALLRAVDRGEAMQLRLGIAPARLTCSRSLRLCRMCVCDDRNRFGRAYWHREHQLPGILSCPKHGCALLLTSVRPERIHANVIFTAPDHSRVVATEHLGSKEARLSRQLSREMAELLKADAPRPGPVRLQAYYRHLLHSSGYSQPNGGVAVARLCADLTEHYGRSFLSRIACLPGRDSNWVAALVRRQRSHQQPIRHVLLLNFLGRSVAQLKEAMALGLKTRNGRPHPFRIKDQGRLKRLRPCKRRAWLEVVTAGRPRSNRDLALYAWLHRNDRLWLAANRATQVKRQTDKDLWHKRDSQLAKQIPRLAARIARERPPRRASRNAIASSSNAVAWLVRDHPLMPKATAAIRAAAEDPTAFALRRIGLIVSKPRFKGPVPVWKLRVMAGINTSLARQRAVAGALRRAASYRGKSGVS